MLANLALLYPDRTIEEAALFRVTRAGRPRARRRRRRATCSRRSRRSSTSARVNPVVRARDRSKGPRTCCATCWCRSSGSSGGRGRLGELVIHEIGGLMAPGDLRQLAASLPVPGGAVPALRGSRPAAGRAARSGSRCRERDRLVHHPYDDFAATVLRLLEEAAARSRRGGGQAHALPHRRELADRGRAAPRGRGGEGGRRVRRAQGQLRRGAQHRLGEAARAGRRAGGLRRWSDSRTTRRSRWSCAGRRARSAATPTSAPATTTPATARVYTDLGLLTADPAIGDDLGDLFNQLTGHVARARRGAPPPARGARSTSCPGCSRGSRARAEHARAGRPARIRAKLNGLDDPEIVRALYDASRGGRRDRPRRARPVHAQARACRGSRSGSGCASLIGRFLEHARIYHFANDGADEYLIASADWRSRNLRRRVEVAAPVLDPGCRRRLDAHPDARARRPFGLGARPGRQLPPGAKPCPSAIPATAQAQAIAAADPRSEEEAVWTG